jgi:GNAT superfamily N-acetyltransferase
MNPIKIVLIDSESVEHAAAAASVLGATSITWRPSTTEIFDDWASTPPHVDEIRYLVFVDDLPVGYARIGTYRYVINAERVQCTVRVIPSHQRQGIATALIPYLADWLKQRPIREVWAQIDLLSSGEPFSPAGERLSEKYGLEPRESRFESVLDTSHVDESTRQQAVQHCAEHGIVITSASPEFQAANPDWEHKLYELDCLCMVDEPTEQGGELPPFETWRAEFLLGQDPEGFVVALDGDRFVGLSIHWVEDDRLLVAATGVHPQYRRNGIARAMKLVGASFGHARAKNLRAFNAGANTSIVELNKRLGFQRVSGQMYWRLRLETAAK